MASSSFQEAPHSNEMAAQTPPLFVAFLSKISEEIDDETFQAMKNLCVQRMSESELEAMKEPFDLLMALMNHGLLSDVNIEVLKQMLIKVARFDLKEMLDKYFYLNSPPTLSAFGISGTEWLIKHLQSVYTKYFTKFQPLFWKEDRTLNLTDNYTKLQIMAIDQRGLEKRLEFSQFKLLDEPLIFGTSSYGYKTRRLRIEGLPGIGKTMFCRKLAYGWACGNLPEYRILFLLDAKQIRANVMVDIVFEQLLPDDISMSREELYRIIQGNEERVLFVIDGLNEVNKSEIDKTQVSKLIIKKIMSRTTSIITTRIHECDKQLRESDSHFRILGFTKDAFVEYIDGFFKDDTGAACKFKSTMQKINAFSSNEDNVLRGPLHAAHLCQYWVDHKDDGKFPSTLTDIYSEILNGILLRYCAIANITLVNDEVPSHVKTTVICKLGECAYSHYLEGDIMFEVNAIEPEWLLSVGLLVRDPGLSRTRPRRLCYFYLETWMEYFTALHIVRRIKEGTSLEEFQVLFDDIQQHKHVLFYIIGLLKQEAGQVFQKLGNAMVQLFAEKPNELSHLLSVLFNLLFESGDYKPYLKLIQPCIPQVLMFTWRLPPHGCYFSVEAETLSLQHGIVCNLFYDAPLRVLLDLLEYEHGMVDSGTRYRRYLAIDIDSLDSTDLLHLAKALENNLFSLRSLTLIGSLTKSSHKLQPLQSMLSKTEALQDLVISVVVDFVTEVVEQEGVEVMLSHYQCLLKSLTQNPHIFSLSAKLYFPKFTGYTCCQRFVNGVQTSVFDLGKCTGPRIVNYFCWGFDSSGLNNIADFVKNCQSTASLKCCLGFADTVDCEGRSYRALRNALLDPSRSLHSLTLGVTKSDGLICDDVMEDIVRILETNATLSELELCLCARNIASLSDLVGSNKCLKSLTCHVPADTLDNKDPYSAFSRLPMELAKNKTLENFNLKMCRSMMFQFHSAHEQASYQDLVLSFSKSVIASLLLPVCCLIAEASTMLKCVSYSFPDQQSDNHDLITSGLEQANVDMVSYRISPYFLSDMAVVSPLQGDLQHEISIIRSTMS